MGNIIPRYFYIPYLECDDSRINKNIDRDKINNYVIYAFNRYLDNDPEYDKPCVIIFSDHGLTADELKIAEGIILANGLEYWEIDEKSK